MKTLTNDIAAMRRCLELALNGIGNVSPNPLVGAVILDNGSIVGEGWHKRYGDIHAEIDAMNNASCKSFAGMTLAVNLEPCSHFGKQPPCIDTIIKKQFSRVIIGTQDPNPLVAGNGIRKLKEAGIEVITGVMEDDCKWINRFFFKHITQKIPYVVMKVAQSLDGCIATSSGESKWITSAESRRRSHVLRSEVDAVLVGINTVIADNPMLNVRLENQELKRVSMPAIVILDSKLRIPIESNIIQQCADRKIIIAYSDENIDRQKYSYLEKSGVLLKNIHNSLPFLLDELSLTFQISSLLVEGGASVFSAFINNDLVDELHIFYAPIIIGTGLHAFSSVKSTALSNCRAYRVAGSLQSGIDEQIMLLRK